MPPPSLCLLCCSYWLSPDFINKQRTTEKAWDQPILSGKIHRRLHFTPTGVLAGCLSLLLLVCTWWYLCWQVGHKGWDLEGIFLWFTGLLWTCSISSIGFHLLKNQMELFVCFTSFWKVTERNFFSFCSIIFSSFVIQEQSWLRANYHW